MLCVRGFVASHSPLVRRPGSSAAVDGVAGAISLNRLCAAAFNLAEGEQRSFSVRVLPIAAGYLPIPHVELMQADTTQSAGQSSRSSVLQQAADKLAAGLERQRQQQQQQATAADDSSQLRISTSAAPASAAVLSSSLSDHTPPASVSYSSIPPSRILRHVSVHHLIHVFPTHNFATQMQPVSR